MAAPVLPVRVPYFAVRIGDQDITSWVAAVQVVEDDRLADSVTVTVHDPRMLYADALIEGGVAEVDLGYAEQDRHALLIRALITKVDVSYLENGTPQVKFKGEDLSILMGLTEKKRTWEKTTVNAIVRAVAKPYRFADVVATLSPDPRVVREYQGGITDLAFLQHLARKHAAKCFVELNKDHREVLYFVPERRILQVRRADTLVLRYRQGPDSNLLSFAPAFDGSYLDRLKQVNDLDDRGQAVTTRGPAPADTSVWSLPGDLDKRANPADLARINALYKSGVKARAELRKALGAPKPVTGKVVPATQQQLDDESITLASRRQGLYATGSTIGTIWLRAKSRVSITGVHERFAGDWYVTAVTHTVDVGGYRSEFKAVR
jgi:phage protein D